MKLLYKPFSLVAGVIAARAGRKTFEGIWSVISDSPRPRPGTPGASVVVVAAAAALEGATTRAISAATNHLAAEAYHALFGIWPDEGESRGRRRKGRSRR